MLKSVTASEDHHTMTWLDELLASLAYGDTPAPHVLVEARKFGIPVKSTDKTLLVRRLVEAGADPAHAVAAVGLPDDQVTPALLHVADEVTDILRLHAEGYTPVEIARVLDVSRPTAHYHLSKRGLEPNRVNARPLDDYQAAKIVEMWEAGEPRGNIAEALGVTENQVRRAIEKAQSAQSETVARVS